MSTVTAAVTQALHERLAGCLHNLRGRAIMARDLKQDDLAKGLEMAILLLEEEIRPAAEIAVKAGHRKRVETPNAGRHWSDDDLARLRADWALGISIPTLSQRYDRSFRAIFSQAVYKLKLPMRPGDREFSHQNGAQNGDLAGAVLLHGMMSDA